MMKRLLAIVIVMLGTILCFSQTAKRTCCSCYNFFSDEEIQFVRDSVVSYNWDSGSESWIKISGSEYAYDNSFKIKEHLIFIVDPGETIKRRLNRYDYEYQKEERLMVRLGYLWNRDLDIWQEATLAKYHYDSSFAVSGRLDFNWDRSSNDWTFNYDNIFTHENRDKEYDYQRKKWSPDMKVWMNDKKTTCSLDDYLKTCVSFDWNNEISEWIFYKRMIYHYNEDENLQRRMVEEWNPELNSWEPSRIFYYQYDHFGREIEWLTHGWDKTGEKTNRGRHLYAYDEHGNRIETLRYRWDHKSQDWIITGKQVEYWTDLVKSNRNEIDRNEIKVYPNPFEELATIELGDYQNTIRIEMIDMFGRTVRIFSEISQPTLTLDRVNLQSGLYLLQVYTTSGTQTIRIIIE